MNVVRPLLTVLVTAGRVLFSDALLQVIGLSLLTVAASIAWGAVGGFAVAGGSLLLIGVALERSD